MRNNRNTLLLISGIINIVKSFVYCITLLLIALCFDVVYLWLKLKIIATDVYRYSTAEQGEKIVTLAVIGIFVFLVVAIAVNFVSAIVNIEASRTGKNALEHKLMMTIISTVNILTFAGFVPSVLTYVALLVDKNQVDGFAVEEKVDKETMKIKIEQIKELKKEKAITQEEYIELLNKLIVG